MCRTNLLCNLGLVISSRQQGACVAGSGIRTSVGAQRRCALLSLLPFLLLLMLLPLLLPNILFHTVAAFSEPIPPFSHTKCSDVTGYCRSFNTPSHRLMWHRLMCCRTRGPRLVSGLRGAGYSNNDVNIGYFFLSNKM